MASGGPFHHELSSRGGFSAGHIVLGVPVAHTGKLRSSGTALENSGRMTEAPRGPGSQSAESLISLFSGGHVPRRGM